MLDLWMILAPAGVLALLVGVGLGILRKTRRVGLVILAVGAVLLCTGSLRAWHRNNVLMAVARTHQQVQNGMSMSEVKAVLGTPDFVGSTDTTGQLQAPWGQKWLDIPGAALAWEYRPYGGIHCYRVYFDDNGRVIGKAAD